MWLTAGVVHNQGLSITQIEVTLTSLEPTKSSLKAWVGSQYVSEGGLLGRVGESLFANLEFELLDQTPMAEPTGTKHEVGQFIELFYNRQRTHQKVGYKPLVELEAIA